VLTRHTRQGLTLAVGLGFGMGLMAGAVALALALKPAPTDAEIVAKARTLGMVLTTELPPAREAPKPPAPQQVIAVMVSEGMSFGEVAAMMKTAGLVADPEALVARAQEREVATKLKAGVHVVPAGSTPDQVIDLLTGD